MGGVMFERRTTWMVLAGLASLGCNAGLGDAGSTGQAGEAETLGSSAQALNGAYDEFYSGYWDEDVMTTWPNHKQFCVLSGVRGDSPQDEVTQRNDGDWRISSGPDDAAWALCFPRDNFRGPAGSVFWYGFCDTGQRTCWWGDAATAIQGLNGEFEGGGEYVKVFQSSNATASSTIVAYSGTGEDIHGQGLSVFYGVPGSGRLVKLMGYNASGVSTRGQVTSSGTYLMSASTYSGFSSYWLAPTSSSFCYFTKLGGDFNGGGEIGRIAPVDGWWFLETINGSGDVWAQARCMAWNQN